MNNYSSKYQRSTKLICKDRKSEFLANTQFLYLKQISFHVLPDLVLICLILLSTSSIWMRTPGSRTFSARNITWWNLKDKRQLKFILFFENTSLNFNKKADLKGFKVTLRVISRAKCMQQYQCRFTTVPLKALSDQVSIKY